MAQFFKRHGIDKCSTHMGSTIGDPMPGFQRIIWSIDIPKVEFVPLGAAISSLENEQPLLTIQSISIEAIREDAQHQHVTLTVSTLVKS